MRRTWPYVCLLISLLFALGVRLRLLSVPLERDEGGFAYIGHMLWQGKRLYVDLADSKLPGLYLLYAFFVKAFGYNAQGIHLGLLLCNTGAAIFLFLLLRRLFGAPTAALATTAFLLTSLSANVAGQAAHATQLLLVPALAGLLLLEKIRAEGAAIWRFSLAGVLLGLAFIIKQPAIFFMPFAGLYLLVSFRGKPSLAWRSTAWLALGAVLPYAIVIIWAYATGCADDFWYWTLMAPAQAGMAMDTDLGQDLVFFPIVMHDQELLWGLATWGTVLAFYKKRDARQRFFAAGWSVFMGMALVVGGYYYPHYFVLVLPGVALLAALVVSHFDGKSRALRVLVHLLFAAAIAQPLVQDAGYFFTDAPATISRKIYGLNPFPESEVIGQAIRSRAAPGDQVMVLGSEPEVLVSSGLSSATRHLYTYALVNEQPQSVDFQREFLQDLIEQRPRFLVVYTGSTSWNIAPTEANGQFWARLGQLAWQSQQYQVIGAADISTDQTVYHWDAEARADTPSYENFQVLVFERVNTR